MTFKLTYAEARQLMDEDGCDCSISQIRELGGHHTMCGSRKRNPNLVWRRSRTGH